MVGNIPMGRKEKDGKLGGREGCFFAKTGKEPCCRDDKGGEGRGRGGVQWVPKFDIKVKEAKKKAE